MVVVKKTKPRVITDSRMRAYRDAKKHESILLGDVDRYIQLLPNDRAKNVIHPSEMAQYDWCPRATWHRLVGHEEKSSALTLRSNLIFSEGHSIHGKWQDWLKDMGILWGRWHCGLCNLTTLAWSNELVGMCPQFVDKKPHVWGYSEVPLRDTARRIAGHADGIVNPSGSESLLLEVKSVGPGTLRVLDVLSDEEADELSSDKFSRITRPAPSHFRQVQIYLRLLANEPVPVAALDPVTRAVIIYEHKADQQVREFVVTYDPKWTDDLFETAEDIVWAIGKGREVACPNGSCKRCKAYEGE
jgi:hypothetical protein